MVYLCDTISYIADVHLDLSLPLEFSLPLEESLKTTVIQSNLNICKLCNFINPSVQFTIFIIRSPLVLLYSQLVCKTNLPVDVHKINK